MANLVNFLTNHGFKIMLVGFGISATGILLFISYIKFGFGSPAVAQYAFDMAIAGLIVYIIGRVFVFIQRKKQRYSSTSKDLNKG